MLKCREPTYNLIGPVMVPLVTIPVGIEILFFSACDAWTMIGTPSNFWSVRPMARGTDSVSLNSIYAIPFERLVLLSVISRTSFTWKQTNSVSYWVCEHTCGFYIAFNNLSVISQCCIDVTKGSKLTYTELPKWGIMYRTFGMLYMYQTSKPVYLINLSAMQGTTNSSFKWL